MAESDSSTPTGVFTAYKITCTITGKSYIGITKRGIEKRWRSHVSVALSQSSKAGALHQAIRVLGVGAFHVEHIASARCYADLKLVEQHLIRQENTLHPGGYNLSGGGQGSDGISELTRKRRSAALSGRTRTPTHCAKLSASKSGLKQSQDLIERRIAPLRGKKQSPEAILARTGQLRGRKHLPEHVEKTRNALIGRKLSAETRAKMAAAKRGRAHSDESRENFKRAQNRPDLVAFHRARMTGTSHSQEAKDKISAGNKGRVTSAETRSKLSEAQRAHQAKLRSAADQASLIL